jgi:polar amino acid transport system permease protein
MVTGSARSQGEPAGVQLRGAPVLGRAELPETAGRVMEAWLGALTESVASGFKWLNANHGYNVTVFYDAYDWQRFVDGLWVTTWLSLVCIVASLVIGLMGALIDRANLSLATAVNDGFFSFFRYTPPLVQIYFVYFGIGYLLPTVEDGFGGREPILGGLALAIVALSCYAGASNFVIFRAAMAAVPRAVAEGALALGYGEAATYRHVVLPLALRLCLAPLLNNLVNLVKATAMAFAVAVPEVVYMTNQIGADAGNRAEMMTLLLVTYCLVVSVLAFGVGKVEDAMRLPGQAA